MIGKLYYDTFETIWYVTWENETELYPSVPLNGRVELHPDDVEVIEVYQMYLGKDTKLYEKEVEYVSLDGYAKLIEPGTSNDYHLYTDIETEIIRWSNEGTETAGTLTRKILEIIEKKFGGLK